MKITNWCEKLRIALVAGGVLLPCAAYAQNIPLGDASFEAFAVPSGSAAAGFAYANSYRPTSAWVDDLDHFGATYNQDNASSNWLYNAAYAEGASTERRRPAPRTGNQAMHGFGRYSAQETGAVFEANKSYQFSVWAQGDSDASGSSSRVWLYIFDGAIPFSEADSLTFARYAPDTDDFANRTPAMTQAQSQANWRQIHLRHHVRGGAPEVGHPIGVGFWGAGDNAVDDATLRVDPLESFFVFLEVNTTSGQVAIKNQTGQALNLDYYEITSAAGSLNATAWNSLQEQNLPAYPAGDGSGNGWEQFGGANSRAIGESYLRGNSAVSNNATIALGPAFNIGGVRDLVFHYGQVEGAASALTGDYNEDGSVDAADYVVWRKGNINGQQGYNDWRANFGASGEPSGPGARVHGFVRYVTAGSASAVPEPAGVLLVGMGLGSLFIATRRRVSEIN